MIVWTAVLIVILISQLNTASSGQLLIFAVGPNGHQIPIEIDGDSTVLSLAFEIFEKAEIHGIVAYQLLLSYGGHDLSHLDLLSDVGICNEAVVTFRANPMYDFNNFIINLHCNRGAFRQSVQIPPISINHPDFLNEVEKTTLDILQSVQKMKSSNEIQADDNIIASVGCFDYDEIIDFQEVPIFFDFTKDDETAKQPIMNYGQFIFKTEHRDKIHSHYVTKEWLSPATSAFRQYPSLFGERVMDLQPIVDTTTMQINSGVVSLTDLFDMSDERFIRIGFGAPSQSGDTFVTVRIDLRDLGTLVFTVEDDK